MAALAQQYGELGRDSEEVHQLRTDAQKGTVARTDGVKPFGPSSRAFARKQRTAEARALAICVGDYTTGATSSSSVGTLQSCGAGSQHTTLAVTQSVPGCSTADQLAGIKSLAREHNVAQAKTIKDQEDALKEYRMNPDGGKKVLDATMDTVVNTSVFSDDFRRVPSGHPDLHLSEWQPRPVERARKAITIVASQNTCMFFPFLK